MTLGLVARCDHRGLGQQTRSVFRALKPAKTLVVNCGSLKPLDLHPEYYPGATFINGRVPNDEDAKRFLDGITAVYSAETFYPRPHEQPSITRLAPQFGVKTVAHINWEFFSPGERADLWAAPSLWHYSDIPNSKVHLPVPVELDRFSATTSDQARRFLHVVGRSAVHDRAGTADVLQALRFVRSDISVTITSQEPGYVQSLLAGCRIPDNIDLRIADRDHANFWDLYAGQDVLISPRRWGGLSLPHQEACASGMPVISTAISPQLDWLPRDWLVPAVHVGQFRARQAVDLYTVDHHVLAERIDAFATDSNYYRDSSSRALGIAKQLSWENLKPEYERVLS